MASSDAPPAVAPGQDTIEATAPAAAQQQPLDTRKSSGSSGVPPEADKTATSPAEQYGIDSEKQSERVGSLHNSESAYAPTPLIDVLYRHWKKVAQLVVFIVSTVFVTPPHLDPHKYLILNSC